MTRPWPALALCLAIPACAGPDRQPLAGKATASLEASVSDATAAGVGRETAGIVGRLAVECSWGGGSQTKWDKK